MKNLTIAFLATASLFTVGACKKKGGGDAGEAVAKMTEFKDEMCKCKDKACADKVQESMTKWSTEMAGKQGDKKDKPDEATMKKMTEVGQAYGECMTKAMSAGAAEPAGSAAPAGGSAEGSAAPAGSGSDTAAAPAGGGGSTGIPECDEYKAAIDKLASCDAIPEATRKTMKDAFDQASGAWAALPAEGKAAAATGCKAGADAVKQAAAACK